MNTKHLVVLMLALLGSALASVDLPERVPAVFRPATLATPKIFSQPKALARAQAADNTWTILVYLHADHNLMPSAIADLNEMEEAGGSETFRVVFQLDSPGANGVQRGLVRQDNSSKIVSGVLETLPEQNSDNPQVLAEFIAWGVKKFPAKRYGLVLWDHGGQWIGFGGDETTKQQTGKASIMTAPAIGLGVRAGMAQAGLQRWDFFGFDTCLMGGLELIHEFGDLTRLYLAAPEIDFGDGWNYGPTFDFLRQNPGVDMRRFGVQEVALWQAQHNNDTSDLELRAHSAYDMNEWAATNKAFEEFVLALNNGFNNEKRLLIDARLSSVSYGLEDPNDPSNFFDVADFATTIAARSSNAALVQKAKLFVGSLNNFIVSKSLGRQNAKAGGVSAFLPTEEGFQLSATFQGVYENLRMTKASNWSRFVAAYQKGVAEVINASNAQPLGVRIENTANLLEPSEREPALVDFLVTGGNVASVFGELGEVSGRNDFDLYGHLYSGPGKAGRYSFPWDGRWFEVGNGNAGDFFCGFYQRPGDNLLFSAGQYQPVGAPRAFDVIVVMDVRQQKIVGLLDNSGAAPRDIEAEPYATLGFSFVRVNQITDEIQYVPTGNTFTLPRNGLQGLEIKRSRLPLGEYVLRFGARDIGNNEKTAFVSVQVR